MDVGFHERQAISCAAIHKTNLKI